MAEKKLPALCIPTARMRAVLGELRGFVGTPAIDPFDTLRELTAGDACRFLPREPVAGRRTGPDGWEDFEYSCETDPSHKQLIVYLLIRRGGKILTYERGMSGGEGRLHKRRSCGLGGHVEECDASDEPGKRYPWFTTINRAAWRELFEETGDTLGAASVDGSTFVGFINDDSDPNGDAAKGKVPVGRVHLGVVYLVTLADDAEPRFAPEIANPRFVGVDKITAAEYGEYENWSQHCIDAMREGRLTL